MVKSPRMSGARKLQTHMVIVLSSVLRYTHGYLQPLLRSELPYCVLTDQRLRATVEDVDVYRLKISYCEAKLVLMLVWVVEVNFFAVALGPQVYYRKQLWLYARRRYFPKYKQCLWARRADSDINGTTWPEALKTLYILDWVIALKKWAPELQRKALGAVFRKRATSHTPSLPLKKILLKNIFYWVFVFEKN